jgi:hypothetical protein
METEIKKIRSTSKFRYPSFANCKSIELASTSNHSTSDIPSKLDNLSRKALIEKLNNSTKIWSKQFASNHISQEIFLGNTSRHIVIGWLLETYHFIKSFPSALEVASNHAHGELKTLLTEYTRQEEGHEWFLLQCLLKAGLSKQDVEFSAPLVSTRSIEFLMKELFAIEPASALLVAHIVEEKNFDQEYMTIIARTLHDRHGFAIDMLKPFFDHISIDDMLGHHDLLKNNLKLLDEINPHNLHDILCKLHDIKLAFELQKMEIKDYYDKSINYIPKQHVDFFSI